MLRARAREVKVLIETRAISSDIAQLRLVHVDLAIARKQTQNAALTRNCARNTGRLAKSRARFHQELINVLLAAIGASNLLFLNHVYTTSYINYFHITSVGRNSSLVFLRTRKEMQRELITNISNVVAYSHSTML